MTENNLNSPLVSVVIIGFNSGEFIETCLQSVRSQTYKNTECLLIDNASHDATVDQARKIIPTLKVIQNPANFGFSRAANQGIENSKGEFIFLLNPDVTLQENFLETLVQHVSQDSRLGSLGGKLLRTGEEASPAIIDTTGLILLSKKRRPLDRGEGEADHGQYDKLEEVFGINGAAVLYRRAMLEDICMDGEYFDNEFFMYFEDVDVAWRAQLKGWNSLYVPTAVGYHQRGGAGGAKDRKVQIHAAKNRYLLYLKNEPWPLFAKHLIRNITVEKLRLLSYMFREPWSLFGYFKFLMGLPTHLKKRRDIQSGIKIDPEDLLSWYQGS